MRINKTGRIFLVLVAAAFVFSSCARSKESKTITCTPEACTATSSEERPDCETEGETHCNGAVIETCTDGTWVTDLDCSLTGQICEAPEDVPTCTYEEGEDGCPDDHWMCEGNKVMFCEEGGVWTENQDCLVEGKTCVDPGDEAEDDEDVPDPFCESPMDGCTEGTFRCNGTVLQQCTYNNAVDDTLWTYEDDCDDWYPVEDCDHDLIVFLNAGADCATECASSTSYSLVNITCNDDDYPPECSCED